MKEFRHQIANIQGGFSLVFHELDRPIFASDI